MLDMAKGVLGTATVSLRGAADGGGWRVAGGGWRVAGGWQGVFVWGKMACAPPPPPPRLHGEVSRLLCMPPPPAMVPPLIHTPRLAALPRSQGVLSNLAENGVGEGSFFKSNY